MSSDLPPRLEIVPLSAPVRAQMTVPGSKSITNRALLCAALSEGEVRLEGALWSEDTQVMVEALQQLGFFIQVEPDPGEPCNRSITVHGQRGAVPRGGTPSQPLDLFVGNAGTAGRFLAALVCLGEGAYRIQGVPRMHERPQSALFYALRQLGYRVDSPNDRLPAVIHGAGPRAGSCRVSIEESSQFASALLLAGRRGGWRVTVVGENAEESPYVQMTVQLMERFPFGGGRFEVEPDASSGSYFWGADYLQWKQFGSGGITVQHWPVSDWQIDTQFPKYLPLPRRVSRQEHLGDSILTAMVLAPFESQPTRFADLGRLRLQECERVRAMRTELTRCGARVEEIGDDLLIAPGGLRGAEIETYDDHRMAMCFAMLGLVVPGMRLRHPACIKKTFPNFLQKLAESPPSGLGACLVNPDTGQRLAAKELFAS